jgi:hypothetical protein
MALNSALLFWKMLAFVRVPHSSHSGLSLFDVCPSNKHCPCARCANAASAVGKDLDIFAIVTIYLNHVL